MTTEQINRAPRTASEMWEVIKDKFLSTITFQGKTYTRQEFHDLSLKS